jgi:hypothetical protein
MTILASADASAPLVFSLGAEEVLILFAPEGLFRRTARSASWRDGLRFSAPPGARPRVHAVIPRPAVRPLLAGPAGHAVEADFKQQLFDAAAPAEWPEFARSRPSRSLYDKFRSI